MFERFFTAVCLLASFAAAAPPEADRKAILSMAGTYVVDFDFRETAAIAQGYALKKPYHEKVTEYVAVAEDEPGRIVLQHVLVIPGKGNPQVIKHWAQVWTWQDRNLLDFRGSENVLKWGKVWVSEDHAAGTWSQLVTQTDDSPRYEGYGKWRHGMGESVWESNPTRRPLPRREYTARDDYDYLLVTNRHIISPAGWVHWQDNRKVRERGAAGPELLCYETGVNTYTRTEKPEAREAAAWWAVNAAFWGRARNAWADSQDRAETSFSIVKQKDGKRLSAVMKTLEEGAAPAGAVVNGISGFITME